jgi:predicted nucleotidyltransferase
MIQETKDPFALNSQPALRTLVDRIVRLVRPLRILVFGSAARGDMGPDSDIDLLVIMPAGAHRRRTAQRIYTEIQGVGVPFDVVVATADDIEKHKQNVGLIYYAILREGREVYAA